MPETLTVNGVDLSTYAANVEHLAGLLRSPELRDENQTAPGRNGVVAPARNRYDAGQVVLPLWVLAPTDELYTSFDALSRLFHAERVQLDHTLPDGSVRRAVCRLDEVIEFPRLPGYPEGGSFNVALSVLGSFWTDTSDTTVGPVSLANDATRVLTEFAAATAPMDELRVTFGPGSNPMLTVVETGVLIAYDDVIPSGQSITFNCETWSVTTSGGLVFDRTKLRTDPRESRWFVLDPISGGATVRLNHTGGGSMNVTIAGRRKWLLG